MLIVAVLVCVVGVLIAGAVLALAVEISGWKGAVVVAAMYVLLAYGVGHSTASASPRLSKSQAHAKAVNVMDDFGPLYDVNGTPNVRVASAPKCARASRVSVRCGVRVETSAGVCEFRLRLDLRRGRVTWLYPQDIIGAPCWVEPESAVVLG